MGFSQTNASPLNGTPTIYKREGAYYKSVEGKLPVTRITSQIEIDAIEKNHNATEFYTVSAGQLAALLKQPASAVKYPPIGKPADVAITGDAAAGLDIAIDGEPTVKTIVVRMGVVGKAGADMVVTTDGNIDDLKEVAGHTLATGDKLSLTFAYFEGTYTTVDAALTSLEAWQWAKPYVIHEVK